MTHVGRRWMEDELPGHINALELQGAYLTLQALSSSHTNVHIRLMLDNTTATMYINKMGGGGGGGGGGGTHSTVCNAISKTIWEWAVPRNIWLSAAYVPSSQNLIADYKSRHFDDNTEWRLSPPPPPPPFCLPKSRIGSTAHR